MEAQVNKLDFTGQNIFIGIDTHKKDWKVTIMLDHICHKTFTLHPPKPELLVGYLHHNFPGGNYFSAYEASYCGYWIHEQLQEKGVHNLVVNAADIPVTHKEKVQKEDKRDSRKIARSLRNGDLRGIYIPDKKSQEDRTLVRYRNTIRKDLTRNKNRLKMKLHYYGIELPEEFSGDKIRWTRRFMQYAESLELSQESGTTVIKAILEDCKYHKKKLQVINKKIRELANSPAYQKQVELLRTIPGIGLIVAMTLLTELVSISRFKTLDELCSFIGLVPRTNSSSDREIANDITPRCQTLLRALIIESSWMAIRYDPSMALAYSKLCGRMKPNKAIIRIAKKLMNRIRYVLKKQAAYKCSIV